MIPFADLVCDPKDCFCKPKPPKNNTEPVSCVESTFDLAFGIGEPKFKPGMQCKDDCKELGKELGMDLVCNTQSCVCEGRGKDWNLTPEVSCAANLELALGGKTPRAPTASMQCKNDCPEGQRCDENCVCQPSRVVTPRCGDGYISSVWVGGGGMEECDTGGGVGSLPYPPAPDTCPAPKRCEKCKCVETAIETDVCDAPFLPLRECEEACKKVTGAACELVYETQTGTRCYGCPVLQCPQGTVADKSACDRQCSGGSCRSVTTDDGLTCYECVKHSCPSGMVSDQSACEQQCPGYAQCIVGKEAEGYNCWKCQVVCEDYCSSQGYSLERQDWSSYIGSYLNQYSCVSGASIRIPGGLSGAGCTCYSTQQPSITIDSTVPVCSGGPCGDVPCGQSKTCTSGQTTITASCNWLGWEEVSENRWVPKIGS
jgi:hypothetical protein